MNTTVTTTIDTELGALRLVARGGALVGVYWPAHEPAPALGRAAAERPDDPVLRRASSQLAEYFAGERAEFEVPLALEGTPFQREVWTALSTIPYGTTVSYAAIAERIGRPRAVRAVGAANARNPISIIVPCHRVIGAHGALTGYAGGLGRKSRLLELESRRPVPALVASKRGLPPTMTAQGAETHR